MRKIISALLLSVLCSLSAWAQMDTEFWFAVPRIPSYNSPIRLVVSTGGSAANVSVTQPAAGATMPVINFTVPLNSVHQQDLTPHAAILQAHPAATALPYGLKVESDVPVLVYYEMQGLNGTNWVNAEVFTLKGTGGMGTSFLIPSQNFVGNTPAYGGEARNAFDIIATEDNTTITITPSADLAGGYTANVPFVITLNMGQVWSASALSRAAINHLPGSMVVSDKPISITVKDDVLEGQTSIPGVSYGACADLVGDQIVPVASLGTEYIAMNGGLMNNPGDQLFVTALQNNTEIYRDGIATPQATINAGQTFRMPAATTPGQTSTYIRTTNPVTVWQLTGMGCEMGATQLPQIECSGSSSVIYSRTMPWDLYVNLMVSAGGQNNFLINGTPLTTATWTVVPGMANQWFTTQLNLSSQIAQGTVLTVSNTSHLFHMSVLDGAGSNSTSYGYFSNYNRVAAEASASSNVVCVGDSIRLFALTVRNGSYTWRGPNGFASSRQNPVIAGSNASLQTGWYHLSVSSTAGGICGSGEDSVYIDIFHPPVVNLGGDLSVCLDSVVLTSRPSLSGAAYLWSDGSTDDSLKVFTSDTYWLAVTDSNGCASMDTISVDIGVAIEANLGPDFSVCDKELPVILTLPQPAGTRYLWSNGRSDTFLTVMYGGRHWVRIEREGCVTSDTIIIISVPTPHLYLGEDSTICGQFPLRIGAEVTGGSYSWNTGETTPYIHVAETGDYILSADVDDCIVHDTISIIAIPPPEIDLGPDDDICPEQTIVIDAGMEGANVYEWSTGETTSSISVTAAGAYSVTVTTEYQCVGSDTIVFSFYPFPVVHLGSDTTVCEETPLQLSAWALNTDSLIWSDGSVGERLLVRYGGDYMVTAVNKCGLASDTIRLSQIFCDIWVPNAFTPNGDGLNDLFRVLGNIGRLDGFTFSVFNRWGERVYMSQDKLRGWDGMYKNGPAQLGTYVYLLQYSIDGRPYTQHGNFHLLR